MNKKHLIEEAKNLYTREFYTFVEIEKKIKISERTLRSWAKKNNWDKDKTDFIQKTDSIFSERVEITKLLGDRIKKQLSKGKEPSAAMLNAYRSLTEGMKKVKDFEDQEKKNNEPNTGNLSEQTQHTIKNVF